MSDLDLVFLFDQRADADPTRRAAQRYARFAQRLNLWLTARTTAGALFEIDLRLRPDGAAGTRRVELRGVVALRAPAPTTRDVGAWTWEHQALTRARFCGRRPRARRRVRGRAARDPRGTRPGRGRARDAARRGRRDAPANARRPSEPQRAVRPEARRRRDGRHRVRRAVPRARVRRDASRAVRQRRQHRVAGARRGGRADRRPRTARAAADAYRTYRARQHASRLADPVAHAARVEATAFTAERASVAPAVAPPVRRFASSGTALHTVLQRVTARRVHDARMRVVDDDTSPDRDPRPESTSSRRTSMNARLVRLGLAATLAADLRRSGVRADRRSARRPTRSATSTSSTASRTA